MKKASIKQWKTNLYLPKRRRRRKTSSLHVLCLMHTPTFDSHNSSPVLSQQFHSAFTRWEGGCVCRGKWKLELISCDRAPLVAHLLTANSLMCIISDMQSFFFCTNPMQTAPTLRTEVFFSLFFFSFKWQRQRGYKYMMARPRHNCRPFLRLDVSDWRVVNITTNKCQYALVAA